MGITTETEVNVKRLSAPHDVQHCHGKNLDGKKESEKVGQMKHPTLHISAAVQPSSSGSTSGDFSNKLTSRSQRPTSRPVESLHFSLPNAELRTLAVAKLSAELIRACVIFRLRLELGTEAGQRGTNPRRAR